MGTADLLPVDQSWRKLHNPISLRTDLLLEGPHRQMMRGENSRYLSRRPLGGVARRTTAYGKSLPRSSASRACGPFGDFVVNVMPESHLQIDRLSHVVFPIAREDPSKESHKHYLYVRLICRERQWCSAVAGARRGHRGPQGCDERMQHLLLLTLGAYDRRYKAIKRCRHYADHPHLRPEFRF